ncbi:1524_t:CDS:2, partial [Ambispora gerdemannii]
LKDSIRAVYQTPALGNDGAVFNVVCDSGKYSPRNDQALREMLRLLVSKNNLKFTVFRDSLKAFSDWSFPKVCQLYGLCESDDLSLSVFPPFICECKELKDDSSRVILRNLITELEARLKSIPISGNEASKSHLSSDQKKNITGPNGHGPVDFAIDLLRTAKTVDVTEIKNEDFYKGIAQNAVQLESALSNCKRKASEMEEDSVFVGKVFGIVTDAEKWYFMECSLDDQDRLRFKLSEPVVVVYKDENVENMVRKILGHIAWLLEEVQKPDSDSREERVIKKHRSSSNLAEKSG